MRNVAAFLSFIVMSFGISSAVEFQSDANTVALWHFDEGSGTALNDASGNNNVGAIVNAVWSSYRGKTALTFNGTNAYVGLGNYILKNAQAWNANTFSVEIVYHIDSFDSTLRELFHTCYNNGEIELVQSNDTLCSQVNIQSSGWHATHHKYASNDSVCYIAFSRDGSTGNIRLYYNGILVDSNSSSGTLATNQSLYKPSIAAYCYNGYGRFFKGTILELRVSSVVRSSSEISAYWASYNGIIANKTGFSNTPSSFSVDTNFNSVSATYNLSSFSSIDSLYLSFQYCNLTYLSSKPDAPVNYAINVGGSIADFGNNVVSSTLLTKSANITSFKSTSANFQITFNYTGGGGELLFVNPVLMVQGTQATSGSLQRISIQPKSLQKISVSPNPSSSSMKIEYSLPLSGKVDVGIFNASGQKIKSVFTGYQVSGKQAFVWNGTDASGRSLAAGNYYLRIINSEGQQLVDNLILTK